MTIIERMQPMARLRNEPLYDWDDLVQEDRVHRLIYTDPAMFDAEMRHIFGGTWVYLAHESQIPNANDFITGKLGLRPLVITRDAEGAIRALYNRCTHRGTTLCRWDKGNAKSFQCPYHGWNFLNTGKLRGVPWPEGYGADMRDPKFNLAQVPRVESYRGFIFGTLNLDAPALPDYLGPIRKPIDEWLDRNPGGKVMVCEANRMKFKGNWKLAYDNSCDGYHVVFSHRSLLETEARLNEGGANGMSYYKTAPDDQPMYIQLHGQRPSLQGQAAQPAQAQRRPVGASSRRIPGMEHVAEKLRARLRRCRRSRARSCRLGAGQHQHVSQPFLARQPYPGVRAALGR